MAIRAAAYARAGGMNTRKAGEDFYFLHKLFPITRIDFLPETAVYPSGRTSDRVPFGTGRAMLKMEEGEPMHTYHWDIFKELREVFSAFHQFFHYSTGQVTEAITGFSEYTRAYLSEIAFERYFDEIKRRSHSRLQYDKAFWTWFNGIKMLKFIHFLRDGHYGTQPVEEAAQHLLHQHVQIKRTWQSPSELLWELRNRSIGGH
jgi:hypothetical protein